MKYDNNRDCNYWELTVVKLLFLIARQNFGNYDGNQRAYMHRLESQLFGWKGDVE